MLTGNKDTDYIILSKTDDKGLLSYCKTNKLAQKICNNDNFWKQRFQNKYGKYIEKNEDRSWKDFYLGVIYYKKYSTEEAYDILWEHGDSHKDFLKLFKLFEKPLDFSKPVRLEKPLIDFLKNANFVDNNDLIHQLIDPVLDKGYMGRDLLTILFTKYMKYLSFSENGKRYYTVDNLMNLYLDPYLTQLEKDGKINRYKFTYKFIQLIILKGIGKVVKLDDYYKLNYVGHVLISIK